MTPRSRRLARLDALESRLRDPKRVALFGHRAVGKTTLLAMFYREAAAGRVPGLRLAATDAATASYLADTIAGLEAGSPPPATLAETPLRLRLYHDRAQLDLVLRDYQGEDVGLDRPDASIRAFLADCDAVFLCLDPDGPDDPAPRRRRQQEVEALLEVYIDAAGDGTAGRPLALLVTKYDRVLAQGGPPPDQVDRLAETHFGMTRHALAHHVPEAGLFAVSAFGPGAVDGRPPAELHPMGLDAPLIWLAERLEAIDREQLEWLWDLVPEDLPRLTRCVQSFAHHYPQSDQLPIYERRLAALRRQRRGRRLRNTAIAAALLVVGAFAYDTWGYHAARRFEKTEPSAVAVQDRWQRLLTWHPTLHLLRPAQSRDARDRLRQWTVRAAAQRIGAGTAGPETAAALDPLKDADPALVEPIRAVQEAAAQREHDTRWTDLLKGDQLPGADPESRLAAYRGFLADYPESRHRADAMIRIRTLQTEVAGLRDRTEQQELDTLRRALAMADPDLADVAQRARRFLDEHPESTWHADAERLLETATGRIDEADIQKARDFSRSYPSSFATRRRKYEEYLAQHASGGRFTREAIDAIAAIDRQRDVAQYRMAYDHAAAYPNDIPTIAQLLQAYLDAQPDGQFAGTARAYLDWWTRIREPQDYRVTLRRGRVDESVGKYFGGGGPDLAVEVWVNGVKHGPSPTVPNSHTPIWNHTFSPPIRWKYGDPVVVRILDFDWSSQGTRVFTLRSNRDEPLAMRLLSGEIRPASAGSRTQLLFESDFKIPLLTAPDEPR